MATVHVTSIHVTVSYLKVEINLSMSAFANIFPVTMAHGKHDLLARQDKHIFQRVQNQWKISSQHHGQAKQKMCWVRTMQQEEPGEKISLSGDESGWCSDVASTHGAWRHAGVRFLLRRGYRCCRGIICRTCP